MSEKNLIKRLTALQQDFEEYHKKVQKEFIKFHVFALSKLNKLNQKPKSWLKIAEIFDISDKTAKEWANQTYLFLSIDNNCDCCACTCNHKGECKICQILNSEGF